ncbi:speckle-type POZ protein-like [Uloborus diversus]|uniref:speckle-type POZ protein-like n=1 Tax=Uloborus diversus TaxID=327109 RepID=UPI0024099285|nr:speckle-type POZ protein-like [Uloborus diversus]
MKFGLSIPRKDGTIKCVAKRRTFLSDDNDDLYWGYRRVVCREEVLRNKNGYLPAGVLTIKCDLTVSRESSSLISPIGRGNHLTGTSLPQSKDSGSEEIDAFSMNDESFMEGNSSNPLANDFEALFNNPRFSDVTLKAGDHEFSAHKLVLSSRSKVFDAMFQRDTQENRQDTVDLATTEVDTVKDMLRYVYCGKVRRLTPGDALRLYAAADRYDLRELVHHCRAIMLSGLSIDNICEISSVADLHHDQTLMDAVKALLAENTKQVLKTDKWQEFAKENPSLVLNLIHAVILNN